MHKTLIVSFLLITTIANIYAMKQPTPPTWKEQNWNEGEWVLLDQNETSTLWQWVKAGTNQTTPLWKKDIKSDTTKPTDKKPIITKT